MDEKVATPPPKGRFCRFHFLFDVSFLLVYIGGVLDQAFLEGKAKVSALVVKRRAKMGARLQWDKFFLTQSQIIWPNFLHWNLFPDAGSTEVASVTWGCLR